MYTPLELEKIEFGNAFMGGYKKEDVEEVFQTLCHDYEELYKESIANRDKISMLEGVVEKYKAMEDALQNALLLAQTSSEAAIRAAQEKAQSIIKEAEDKASYLAKEANASVQDLSRKEADMKRGLQVFATRQISNLRAQIEVLNGMIAEGTKSPIEDNLDATMPFHTKTEA
ncbi:MAG: DivIVA domain-containing protein [Clostridia bacterium]|nr:DivIVA domain-containing protein [Clostridia bacterium]